MIEQAKEELQILEAQHPNRFEYLKLELKSFISLLESQSHQHFLLSKHAPISSSPVSTSVPISIPNAATTMTQESSTRKKRKKGSSMRRTANEKLQRTDSSGEGKGNQKRRDGDGVDAAIQKAQACLHKIQQFKTSF